MKKGKNWRMKEKKKEAKCQNEGRGGKYSETVMLFSHLSLNVDLIIKRVQFVEWAAHFLEIHIS